MNDGANTRIETAAIGVPEATGSGTEGHALRNLLAELRGELDFAESLLKASVSLARARLAMALAFTLRELVGSRICAPRRQRPVLILRRRDLKVEVSK
jgi:hypothetical protein